MSKQYTHKSGSLLAAIWRVVCWIGTSVIYGLFLGGIMMLALGFCCHRQHWKDLGWSFLGVLLVLAYLDYLLFNRSRRRMYDHEGCVWSLERIFTRY